MAKQTTVVLVDDLDGSVASETVQFALDGTHYTIDLSTENAEKLRTALSPYRARASRITPTYVRRQTRLRTTADRQTRAAIRTWAQASGRYPNLADHGRIPFEIVDDYQKTVLKNGRP